MRRQKVKARAHVEKHVSRFGKLSYRVRMFVDGECEELGLYEDAETAEQVKLEALSRFDGQESGMTLAKWGQKWLDRRDREKLHRNVGKSRSCWRTHVETATFADWPMRKLKRTDVVRWVRELMLSESTKTKTFGRGANKRVERQSTGERVSRTTVVNALALLRRALTDAADEGHVPGNVAIGVSVPRQPRVDEPWTWLTADEIGRVLGQPLREEQRAIYTVAIFSGLRGGELWGLRWCDVTMDGPRPEVHVRFSYRNPTKAGKTRRVPLLPQALEALRVWRAHSNGIGQALVWPAHHGGCHSEGYDAGWLRMRQLAGIERTVRFHDLRHTCGSHLVQGTWMPALRLEDVRLWLGHSAVSTTERYAHLSPDRLHAIAQEAHLSGTKNNK